MIAPCDPFCEAIIMSDRSDSSQTSDEIQTNGNYFSRLFDNIAAWTKRNPQVMDILRDSPAFPTAFPPTTQDQLTLLEWITNPKPRSSRTNVAVSGGLECSNPPELDEHAVIEALQEMVLLLRIHPVHETSPEDKQRAEAAAHVQSILRDVLSHKFLMRDLDMDEKKAFLSVLDDKRDQFVDSLLVLVRSALDRKSRRSVEERQTTLRSRRPVGPQDAQTTRLSAISGAVQAIEATRSTSRQQDSTRTDQARASSPSHDKLFDQKLDDLAITQEKLDQTLEEMKCLLRVRPNDLKITQDGRPSEAAQNYSEALHLYADVIRRLESYGVANDDLLGDRLYRWGQSAGKLLANA